MAHESPAETNPAHSLDDMQNTPLHLIFLAKKMSNWISQHLLTYIECRSGQVLDKDMSEVFEMGVGAFWENVQFDTF